MVELKTRKNMNNKKKILIFGSDGSGKSTFAEKYCKENNLNAVVLDIEDTNYTELPLVTDFDLSNDIKAYRGVSKVLKEIKEMDGIDTVIIDGVDTLIESFISNAQGMKCYADRSKTFLKFLRDCTSLDMNLIFVGQAPMDLDWYKADENPNKCIVKMNSLANEKYRTVKTGNKFTVETTKMRK